MWWTCCCPGDCFGIWDVCPNQEIEAFPVLWFPAPDPRCCDDLDFCPELPGTVRQLRDIENHVFCYELREYSRVKEGVQAIAISGVFVDCDDCVRPDVRACCFPGGVCQDLTPAECASQGGITQPLGQTCANTTCPDNACIQACSECIPPNRLMTVASDGMIYNTNYTCGAGNSPIDVQCDFAKPFVSYVRDGSDNCLWQTEDIRGIPADCVVPGCTPTGLPPRTYYVRMSSFIQCRLDAGEYHHVCVVTSSVSTDDTPPGQNIFQAFYRDPIPSESGQCPHSGAWEFFSSQGSQLVTPGTCIVTVA